jgi:hypothetical protein
VASWTATQGGVELVLSVVTGGGHARDFRLVYAARPRRRRRRRSPEADLERASLLRAIDAANRAFLVELRLGDPGLADRLEPALTSYVEAAREPQAAVRLRA